MKKYSLLFLIIILIGCTPSLPPSKESFYNRYFLQWITTYKIEWVNKEWVKEESVISGPSGVWQPLIKIHTLGTKANSVQSFCVYYRFPSSKSSSQRGIIKVLTVHYNQSCGDLLKTIDSPFDFQSITSLYWVFTEENEKVVKGEIIPPFHWAWFVETLEGENKKSERDLLLFPLYNLQKNPSSYRYRPSWPNQLIGGVSLLAPHYTSEESLDGEVRQELMGDKNMPEKSEKWVICHEKSPQGKELIPYRCDHCRYGWVMAITRKGVAKFCGMNRCGERFNPACIRFPYKGERASLACITDSPWAFCREGLHPICDANGILICN